MYLNQGADSAPVFDDSTAVLHNGSPFSDAFLQVGDRLSVGGIDLEILAAGQLPDRPKPEAARPTHVRDAVVYEHPRGAAAQWVALGDGSIDFHAFFKRFAQLCPGAPVQFEIITGRPPRVLPYLEPDFWNVYPKAKASEFARFVALAKTATRLRAR